jgi:molybdopterin-containing oxidoreductase family iron-sulfur binding subunit
MSEPTPPLDLAAVRDRLRAVRGPEYWRSLEELAQSEEFVALLQKEFPRQALDLTDSAIDRRRFLTLMGASLALAGLSGCPQAPPEKIMPYVRQPEEVVPGKPMFFATAMPLAGYATGVVVESHLGRPTKIEGNKKHPASKGATSAFAQASILGLYDPDRSQTVKYLQDISGWDRFSAEMRRVLRTKGQKTRLRVLTETVTSPTLSYQLRALLDKFPEARWHRYEPCGRDNVREGARLAFGKPIETIYRFDLADVVLSLDADFLTCGPGHVRYVRDFVQKRRSEQMNRLYAVESTPTLTGAKADHRQPLRAGQIEGFGRTLAKELGIKVEGAVDRSPFVKKLVDDLAAPKNRRKSIVVAGDHQPPAVHVLAHALNHKLGNAGKTVIYLDPDEGVPADAKQPLPLADLVKDMKAGSVDILLILGGNPVYTAPADLGFEKALTNVKTRIHLSLYDDETSELCNWHVAEAHYLESWSDARAYDGTVSILQPLIAPLYGGKTAHEVLALFNKPTTPSQESGNKRSHDIVQAYWRDRGRKALRTYQKEHGLEEVTASSFELWWRRALHDGLVAKSEFQPAKAELRQDLFREAGKQKNSADGMEIIFRPDPTIFDGRFANNGWLQELPKPLSKLTWDNAAYMGKATAEKLGLANEDMVTLSYRERTVEAPVWILPGHAEDSVTVHLGYGRTRAGQVGTGTGFNAYALRASDALDFSGGLEIRKLGQSYLLACTQTHHAMEGRHLVRSATLKEYQEDRHFVRNVENGARRPLTLYADEHKYDGHKWGMVIDLNSCTGCGACVVACQAENNIPVVGKDQVSRGREMHWLRVDRYYRGDVDRPESLETFFQPVPCMQCENAPCELVCPVGATVHSHEGLNDMVYNRCVGTRYCSNNCPYKVRRFNFLSFIDYASKSLKLMRNPDVTVRSRGVMEKCTYCVQRINRARIEAEKEERPIKDGEIVTACQAACPATAIVFGDLSDLDSKAAKMRRDPRNYGLLEDQNTRPRTTYLAVLKNPGP